MKTRTAAVASALALTAATTVAVAPAHAGPAGPAPETGAVHYQGTTGSDSAEGAASAEGSLENPIIGAALVLLVGVGVSAALAVGAGVAGGAFELPEIPGLPF